SWPAARPRPSRASQPVSTCHTNPVDSTEVIIRVAADPRRAEGWSFVLEALGIPHRVVTTDMGAAVVVPAMAAPRATAALDAHDREAAETAAIEPAAPDEGPSSLGVAIAMGLVAFF